MSLPCGCFSSPQIDDAASTDSKTWKFEMRNSNICWKLLVSVSVCLLLHFSQLEKTERKTFNSTIQQLRITTDKEHKTSSWKSHLLIFNFNANIWVQNDANYNFSILQPFRSANCKFKYWISDIISNRRAESRFNSIQFPASSLSEHSAFKFF